MARPQSLVSLYTNIAMACDAKFAAELSAHGFDRWETCETEWTDEIRRAYQDKVRADAHVHQAWELARKKGAIQ